MFHGYQGMDYIPNLLCQHYREYGTLQYWLITGYKNTDKYVYNRNHMKADNISLAESLGTCTNEQNTGDKKLG
jgi:hypothetical protein